MPFTCKQFGPSWIWADTFLCLGRDDLRRWNFCPMTMLAKGGKQNEGVYFRVYRIYSLINLIYLILIQLLFHHIHLWISCTCNMIYAVILNYWLILLFMFVYSQSLKTVIHVILILLVITHIQQCTMQTLWF